MKKQAGFSLIEMMVVIAIIAILLSAIIPNYFGKMPAQRLQAAISEIQGALHTARMGAVKENTSASVSFDIPNDNLTATVDGRTVRQVQMPPDIHLTSVYRAGTTTPESSVNFDSRGLANRSIDINVDGGATVDAFRISLALSGNSKVFRN